LDENEQQEEACATCFWQGCYQMCEDIESLEKHFRDTHLRTDAENVCLWRSCGTVFGSMGEFEEHFKRK
jgi:hypothetical protein